MDVWLSAGTSGLSPAVFPARTCPTARRSSRRAPPPVSAYPMLVSSVQCTMRGAQMDLAHPKVSHTILWCTAAFAARRFNLLNQRDDVVFAFFR